MPKKVLILCLSAMLALIVSGCGSRTPGAEVSPTGEIYVSPSVSLNPDVTDRVPEPEITPDDSYITPPAVPENGALTTNPPGSPWPDTSPYPTAIPNVTGEGFISPGPLGTVSPSPFGTISPSPDITASPSAPTR